MLHALTGLLLTLQRPQPAETPRLVVIVVVDQLVPEQLQRLAPVLTGGFKRFLDEGAVFWNATVDYAATETGPGHATIATGRYPSRHGIVGNLFLDDQSRATVYCVGDAEARALTDAGVEEARPGASPARRIGDSLGDLLAERKPGSKCLAIAGKDRSAILLAGRHPEAALWWNGVTGGFASSSYYGDKLPEFVGVWNSAWGERAGGWKWECSLTGDLARLGTQPDDQPGESSGGGRTLPRTLPTAGGPLAAAVMGSPLIDMFTLELATLAVDALALGQDDAPDYLGVSLSGCDLLGHAYGPTSVEVTDLLARDDRDLGRFFAQLDAGVGKGRWVACLTSDHGVLNLPEVLQARQVGARRVGGAEVAALRETVQDALDATFGDAELGLRYGELGFTLDEAKARAAGIEPAELRALVAEAARETKWVADAYTREELEAKTPRDAWVALYQKSWLTERCPDVTLRPDPWLLFDFPEGTSHGSPYPYDRRVPLAFLGGRVRPEQRFDAASPVDTVPTLLELLGLKPPADLDGRALHVH